jgi:hypothetical protein
MLLDSENLAERAIFSRSALSSLMDSWGDAISFTSQKMEKHLRLLASIISDEVGPNRFNALLTKHRHDLSAMVG